MELKNIDQLFIPPNIKLSHKSGIPVICANLQNNASAWSNKVRECGGIILKFWDHPINCLAKLCEYSKYLRNLTNQG